MPSHPETFAARELQSAPDRMVRVDGVERLYFGGTGYLGLQSHPEVAAAAVDAVQRYGLHAASSRVFCGETPPLRAAEAALAEYFASPAAFLTPTGYAGASIVARAVRGDVDRVFLDAGSHACVQEAAVAIGRPVHRFATGDAAALADALAGQLQRGERPLVMADAVEALCGGLLPLPEYRAVLVASGARQPVLLVDDAHGVGVLGENGRGTTEHFGFATKEVNRSGCGADLEVRTFFCATTSKALGGFGGCIVGDEEFVAVARRASHWYDGASPPPCPVSAATAAALRIAQREPERRRRLAAHVRRVRHGLAGLGLPVDTALPTPAIGFALGDAAATVALHRRLDAAGILVPYSASYGADDPVGTLRIALFATHTDADLDRLLDTLARVL